MTRNEIPRTKIKKNNGSCLRNTFFILAVFFVAAFIVALSHNYINEKFKVQENIIRSPVILAESTLKPGIVKDNHQLVPSSTKISVSIPDSFISQTKKKDTRIHFIHIPKCGGTTMTAVLRQIQCSVDPIKNTDCCLNPGFCDWHAKRRCATIEGCINHIPNRYRALNDVLYSYVKCFLPQTKHFQSPSIHSNF